MSSQPVSGDSIPPVQAVNASPASAQVAQAAKVQRVAALPPAKAPEPIDKIVALIRGKQSDADVFSAIDQFVKAGGDINQKSNEVPPLMAAVSAGKMGVVRELVTRFKADPSVTNNGGNTALHFALSYGRSKEDIEELIGLGCSIVAQTKLGITPFMKLRADRENTAACFLQEGRRAHLLLKDNEGKSVLHYFWRRSSPLLQQLLLIDEVKRVVKDGDNRGLTAIDDLLSSSVTDVTYENCRLLLGAGCKPARDPEKTILGNRTFSGDLRKQLLSLFVVEEQQGERKEAPQKLADKFRDALKAGASEDALIALLLQGGNVDQHDVSGMTPFYRALYFGKLRVATNLVSVHRVDPKKMLNVDKQTPLHWHLYGYENSKPTTQSVQAILDLGAPLDEENASGRTPLFLAASFGLYDVAEFLFDKGAEVREAILRNASQVDKVRHAQFLEKVKK